MTLSKWRCAPPWVLCSLLVALVLTAFVPILRHDFVSWDDFDNYCANPLTTSVTAESWRRMWTQKTLRTYRPLSGSLILILAKAGHSDAPVDIAESRATTHVTPFPFHAASLVLHAGTVLVLFALLLLLLEQLLPNSSPDRRRMAAFIATAIFAIHPVQAEPVAWATGLTDLTKGLFTFAALWQYLKFATSDDSKKTKHYAAATILYFAGILAHPAVVITPFLAALLGNMVARRPWRLVLLPLIPWVLLAAPFIYLATGSENLTVTSNTPWADLPAPWFARLFIAADAIVFYLRQLVFPFSLGIDYGRKPSYLSVTPLTYAAILPLLVLGGVLYKVRKRVPWLAIGAVLFIVALLPNLGFIPARFQLYSTVADRYLYLPFLGVSLAIAGLLVQWRGRVGWALGVALTLILTVICGIQVGTWRNNRTLFTQAIAANPNSAVGFTALGRVMLSQGDTKTAEKLLRHSQQINPDYLYTYRDLGTLLLAQDRWTEAEGCYRIFLAKKPDDFSALRGLGFALGKMGQTEEAHVLLLRALEQSPRDAATHYALGVVLAEKGRNEDAKVELEKAIELHPRIELAWWQLGLIMQRLKRPADAEQCFKNELRVQPNHAPSLAALAKLPPKPDSARR